MLHIGTFHQQLAYRLWRWLRDLPRRVSIPRGQVRHAIVAPAIAVARASHSRFGRPIAFVLSRSVIVVIERLPISGFTWPLLPTNLIAPLILLDKSLVDAALAEVAVSVGRDVNRAAIDSDVGRDVNRAALPSGARQYVHLEDGALYSAPYSAPYAENAASRRLAEVLLHEALHHCGVVWPEWRNWVNSFARWVLCFIRWRDRRFPVFPYNRIYGVGVNSADTLAARLLEEAGRKEQGVTCGSNRRGS